MSFKICFKKEREIMNIHQGGATARGRTGIIFCRGVYLAENTYQAASVEFVRRRRTNYARSRLQPFCRKSPKGVFDSLKFSPGSSGAEFYELGCQPA